LAQQILGEDKLSAHWRAVWRDRADVSIREAAACLLGRDDVTDRLPRITCPVLLIRGGADKSVSAESMRALRDGLPAATAVHEIDGAAHAPNLTHPGRVNALLTQFLVNVFTPPRG
jgi:pimeloyl-ACP methyl ester carboxylesterase